MTAIPRPQALHMERLQRRGYEWPVPWPAVALIARYEACRPAAYLCPAGVWTCGWGETDGVGPTTVWTEEQCDRKLYVAIEERTELVRARLSAATTPSQLGAMVSLHYNIGEAGFARSTVLRRHNSGDHDGAARAFAMWNRATVGGRLVVLRGLTLRRAAEAALYLVPEGPTQGSPA